MRLDEHPQKMRLPRRGKSLIASGLVVESPAAPLGDAHEPAPYL